VIYRPNCVASLLAGYDGSMNKWDDNHRYLSQDGVEIAPVGYPIRYFPLICHVILHDYFASYCIFLI